MTEQEIINNAPEGWTHYDVDDEAYIKNKDGIYYWYNGFVWKLTSLSYITLTRSRADIERIVELEKDMAQTMMYIEECTERLKNQAKELDNE